jgi:4-hydroxybenzoate polyprenyltransferase
LLGDFLKTIRPQQWIKNLFLFAGLIFSRSFHQIASIRVTIFAFLSFCLLSSGVYIINDLVDVAADRLHPVKSRRPIAQGKIGRVPAVISAFVLIAGALTAAFFIGRWFFVAALVYLAMMILYSLKIKEVVILDVLFIAFGYVLRAAAGALAIQVEISSWLLLCTFLLALFLVISKRRAEIVSLGPDAARHRKILGQYDLGFLDQVIAVVTSACIVSYCLYTLAPETVVKFHTRNLIFTVPFVIYGLFRYLYLVFQGARTDQPEKVVVTDLPILICLILWIGSCLAILIRV